MAALQEELQDALGVAAARGAAPARRAAAARPRWSPPGDPPPDRRGARRAGPTCRRCSSTSPRSRRTSSRTPRTSCRPPEGATRGARARSARGDKRPARRYQVNVLVDHAAATARRSSTRTTRPTPTWSGRVEHVPQLGHPGHRLHADQAGRAAPRQRRLPGARRAPGCSRSRSPGTGSSARCARSEIRIESLGQVLSLVSTVSLEPEPIPLDVKVVLIGERHLYYLLAEPTRSSASCSRSPADFEDEIERTPDGEHALRPAARHPRAPRGAAAARPRRGGARRSSTAARLAGDARASCRARMPSARRPAARGRPLGRRGRARPWSAADATCRRALDAQAAAPSRIRERVQEAIRARHGARSTPRGERGRAR